MSRASSRLLHAERKGPSLDSRQVLRRASASAKAAASFKASSGVVRNEFQPTRGTAGLLHSFLEMLP